MIREPLERCRYTGNRAETDKLIAWLLDNAFWFEVQLADEFSDGNPEWEIVCGQLVTLDGNHIVKSEEAYYAQ